MERSSADDDARIGVRGHHVRGARRTRCTFGAASFRQHPLEIMLVTLAQNAPLVLLGLPLGSHALVLLLLRLNTVFVHADLELPRGRAMQWLSEVVATPAMPGQSLQARAYPHAGG